MNERERGTHMINLGMTGNLAQAVSRVAMRDNRPVTMEEVEFVNQMPDQTAQDIANFCYDRGIEPSIVIGIHDPR